MLGGIKNVYIALGVVLLSLMFNGCTQVSGEEPVYVYGMGMEVDGENTNLYVLMGKNEDKERQSDGKTAKNGDKGSESSESEKKAEIMRYQGGSVDGVLDNFFKQHKDLYTGTVGVYVLSKNMTDGGITDFKVYLTNSNKLPAKRDTVIHSDPYGYLSENSEQLMKK